MMKVFVGGSRRLTSLNKDVREHLEEILKKGHAILVGDANGADKAIQQFICEQKYESVKVFCSGTICRNNLGNWEVKNIQSERASRDFAFYVAKDLEMTKQADYGFMLWDGKSKGTLNNILTMLESSKKVHVYFSPKHLLVKLISTRDLMHFLKHCDAESQAYFEKTLHMTERLTPNEKLFKLA
jgi:hypothetical protein